MESRTIASPWNQILPGGGGAGPVGPANVVFHSAWNTALGTSDAAIRDTGLAATTWDGHANAGNNVLSVVAGNALPRGMPAPPDGLVNVLQAIRAAGVANPEFCTWGVDGAASPTFHIPVLADGEIVRWRFYGLMDVTNAEGSHAGGSDHPVQIPWNVSNFCGLKWNNAMADGTMTWGTAAPNAFDKDNWCLGTFNGTTFLGEQIPKFVWYRHEYAFGRIDATHYIQEHRIYNAAGTLLYSPDGVGASLGAIKNITGGTQVTEASFNIGGQFNAPASADYTRSFAIGHNGGTVYAADQYYHWAGVCIQYGSIVTTLPAGAYNAATGI